MAYRRRHDVSAPRGTPWRQVRRPGHGPAGVRARSERRGVPFRPIAGAVAGGGRGCPIARSTAIPSQCLRRARLGDDAPQSHRRPRPDKRHHAGWRAGPRRRWSPARHRPIRPLARQMTAWRREQTRDRFFRQAKRDDYRARSAYKLLELNRRFKLFKRGDIVLDLGAAPGSWSQVAAQCGARVVAVDLTEIEALPGVTTVLGDIADPLTQVELRAGLGGPADAILSDV